VKGQQTDGADDEQRGHVSAAIGRQWRAARHGSSFSFGPTVRVSKIVYSTKLSTVECLQRLESHVIPWSDVLRSTFTPMAKGTVVAKVHGDRFRLFAQGPKYVQNSFVPLFYGRVEATTEGARVIGRFRMHLFVRVFMGVWFGGLTIMAIVIPAVALFGTASAGRPPFILIIGPLLMILFGIGLLSFGRWVAREQVASIHEFLRTDLDGRLESVHGPNQALQATAAPPTS
jgi:hypothetical protein